MSLSTKIIEIEELLNLKPKASAKYTGKRRTSKQASMNIIHIRYSEVVIVLRRIDESLKKKKKIHDRMDVIGYKNHDSEMLSLFNEDIGINRELQVDLKSLYLWVHMIKIIFLDCKIPINLKELTRISYLRNKFITHITESSLFKNSKNTQGGMLFHAKKEEASILFIDVFDRKKFIGFKKLINQVKNIIPELKIEKNMYEQTKILYKNINKLKGNKLEHEANEYISRIGVGTEQPIGIADELLRCLKEYRKIKKF